MVVVSNLENTLECHVVEDTSESIAPMIKQLSQGAARAGSAGLLAITVVKSRVDEVRNAQHQREPWVHRAIGRGAVAVVTSDHAEGVACEACQRDQIWSQPHGQFGHDPIAHRALNILVV